MNQSTPQSYPDSYGIPLELRQELEEIRQQEQQLQTATSSTQEAGLPMPEQESRVPLITVGLVIITVAIIGGVLYYFHYKSSRR